MIPNPKIGAIVFYVKDMARTEKFYRDTLGLKTRMNPGHGHGDHEGSDAWMITDVGETSLIFFTREEKPGRSPIVVFILDGGIDDIVESLAQKGVQIITPVSEAPGGWSADFTDPDGHVLSFYQTEKAPRRKV